MRVWVYTALAAVCVMFGVSRADAGLSVTAIGGPVTPTSMATSLLGPGITISGPVTYTGVNVASGEFSGGLSAGIGIDTGIILTSGAATNAIGPNNSGSTTLTNGAPGDAILSAIAGGPTQNAAILTIPINVAAGGDVFFNYVFGSEEYNEYVGSQYNDVFAFLLDGVNIALIPSTAIPVAINTVNLGSNSAYYNNNSPGPFDIQYDGFTTVLTAAAFGLTPGAHVLEIAIADTGDDALDSGVFLQAGTLSTENPTVPEASSVIVWSLLGLCGGGVTWRRRKRAA